MSPVHQNQVNEFAEFGQRLIDLGMAMKRDRTTVGQLQELASSCGIKLLHLRSVSIPDNCGNVQPGHTEASRHG